LSFLVSSSFSNGDFILIAGYNMSGYLEGKGTSLEKNFDLDIETKSNTADFCTKVDVMNEILIMEGIQAAFPGHDIIGEETVGTGELPPLRRDVPTWIIDPIGEFCA
jgi:myo-inositol-1(or 4)-monophosphatase